MGKGVLLFLAGILLCCTMTSAVFADTTAPIINEISVTPGLVAAGDYIRLTVNVTDDVGVTSVTAGSASLWMSEVNIWEADILADPALGEHVLTIIASDEAGNSSSDSSGRYFTLPVFGTSSNNILHPIMFTACQNNLYRVWGNAKYLDENSFTIDDGGKYWIKAIAPEHTVISGDYVVAHGMISNPYAPPAVLNCSGYQILKMGPRKLINISNVSIGKDLQVSNNGSLSEMVPYGVDKKVTITSSDPGKVLLSRSATVPGSRSITVTVPGGSSNVPAFNVQSLASSGVVDVTLTAPGGFGGQFKVTLQPSGFLIYSPTSINTTTFSSNTNLSIRSSRLNPSTLAYANVQELRPGLTASVNVTSSDTTVGTITTSPVVFTGNVSSINTQFDPSEAGTSTISIDTPEGFTTPSNYQQLTATVTAPDINFSDVTVGKDLQTSLSLSLQSAPPSPTDVVVTVGSGSIAAISPNATVEGTQSITFTNVTSTYLGTIYVQGMSLGTTTLTASAPGYSTRVRNITVDPSGFVIYSPTSITTTASSGNTSVNIRSARLNPENFTFSSTQALRAGMTVDVSVITSDPAVGVITTSPLTFTGNVSSINTAFAPVGTGECIVSVEAPDGFSVPTTYRKINAVVNP